jgi:multiple sugar transport system ATP-binding protein
VIVGVRPEALELAGDGVPATVDAIEELGSDAFIFCTAELPDGPGRLTARVDARHAPARGARVRLRPSPEHEPHLFDAASGERLAG